MHSFFAKNQLPSLSIERITAAQIDRLFAPYRNPHRPTDLIEPNLSNRMQWL